MARIVVIGAGVGGLSSALVLSRAGHEVTVVERDATPLPDSADGAFAWDRRGAPQVRHSHALLARLRNALRDHYPDVLVALLDAGATEMDFIAMMPEGMDPTPAPGDEDLVALACRRTTFEWVLRTLVLAEPHVSLLDGVAVTSLNATHGSGPVQVRGVRLDDGRELAADHVIAAGGRRGNALSLLAEFGIDLDEVVEDTGIVYYSRFYRLREGYDFPVQNGPIGGDLGYAKYGVFIGDNRTFSITQAISTGDDGFRKVVNNEAGFQAISANIPATAPYVDGRSEPIGPILPMAQLLNRSRRFLDDEGHPKVLGFSAVGDDHTCTNPLYGRGCSLAFVMAELFSDALAAHPNDLHERALAYEDACRREIRPWYKAAVRQDAIARAGSASAAHSSGASAPSVGHDHTVVTASPPDDPMRQIMRDGIGPALRTDPVVFRAFLRMFNLLESPDSLMTNSDAMARVLDIYQRRDERPPEAPLGPDRTEMLARIQQQCSSA